MRSSSSLATVSMRQKLKEAITFLTWRLSEGSSLEGFDRMFKELDCDREVYERLTGHRFEQARALEIGYGARPFRLLALTSIGLDVRGIDLDQPMLEFSPRKLFQILRRNGTERAIKTGVRTILFDRKDRTKLRKSLNLRGYALRIEPARFLVGDATTYDFGPELVDLVYSNDVFEHIPPIGLKLLVSRLVNQITPDGLALITPGIFTGITGGHLPEWYEDLVELERSRSSEPWEHLRKRRYVANSYLNGLSRADYRELFSPFFEILEEKVLNPDLGRRWLTPDVRTELSTWSDEELFSNRVQFALRPRRTRV